MIELINSRDVCERMGVPFNATVNPSMSSAVKAAHLRVQGILGTKFDQKVIKDTFYLDRNKTGGVLMDKEFCLRLTQAFVQANHTPVVNYGELATGCTQTLDPLLYHFDWERGFLYVDESYEEYFIEVTYQAGFIKDDQNTIVPTPPDELIEGIIGYTPAVIDFSKPGTVGTKVADQNKRNAIEGHVFDVLIPLLRNKSLSIVPTRTGTGTLP